MRTHSLWDNISLRTTNQPERETPLGGRRSVSSVIGKAYAIICGLFAVITFVVRWFFFIIEYGILFGLILGWIPALFSAVFAAAIWPIALVSMFYFDLYINVK